MYSENMRNESVCAGLSNEYTHNETVCILGTGGMDGNSNN
jgi:hypothetical protein